MADERAGDARPYGWCAHIPASSHCRASITVHGRYAHIPASSRCRASSTHPRTICARSRVIPLSRIHHRPRTICAHSRIIPLSRIQHPSHVGAGIARPRMRFYPVFRLIYVSSSGIYIVFPPKKRAGDARPYEWCENSPALSRAGDVFIRHLIPFTRYSSKALSVRSDSSVSRRSNTPLPPEAPASRTTFSAGPSPRKPIL